MMCGNSQAKLLLKLQFFVSFKQATCRRKLIFACVSPPLIFSSQKVVSSPTLPRRPFSIKSDGQLHTPSKVQIYEYNKDEYLTEEEYDYHCKITCIPFFARFKMWKPFYIWRSKVRDKKTHMTREALTKHLFIVSQVYNSVYKVKCEFLSICSNNLEYVIHFIFTERFFLNFSIKL